MHPLIYNEREPSRLTKRKRSKKNEEKKKVDVRSNIQKLLINQG